MAIDGELKRLGRAKTRHAGVRNRMAMTCAHASAVGGLSYVVARAAVALRKRSRIRETMSRSVVLRRRRRSRRTVRGRAAVLANSGREPFGLVGLEVMAVGGAP